MEYLSKLNNKYLIRAKFADHICKWTDTLLDWKLKKAIKYVGSEEYISFIYVFKGCEPTSIRLYITPNIAIQCIKQQNV